ncbi:MAG: inositol-3-phosphate synthase [Myxococcales bacterium]|nr:inositol-3-phosphate synthase [Myxococcales bacterium]
MTAPRKLGLALVGVGGAVGSTVAAGLALLRRGAVDTTGLPLAEFGAGAFGLADYDALVVAGWDVFSANLTDAARHHRVLDAQQLALVEAELASLQPWPGIADAAFVHNLDGAHRITAAGRRAQVDTLRADLRRFKTDHGLDAVVVINTASTEKPSDPGAGVFADVAAFEAGLDRDDAQIGPAALYAYAALSEGMAYGNFTPSSAVDLPALSALARAKGLPVAGRDGKTGQTFLKTVIAPALRARALHVDGWYSTNILGNRDGEVLDDPDSLRAKLGTKGDVLDSVLGYRVADHKVRIDYYRPRGDEKEAWDNIDVSGFLGYRMQIKVNFLARDSILAAPLVIELARCLDLAQRRGQAGPIEALGTFFKAPMALNGEPQHAFGAQQLRFLDWLRG